MGADASLRGREKSACPPFHSLTHITPLTHTTSLTFFLPLLLPLSCRRDILTVHLRGVPIHEQEVKEDLVFRLAKVTGGFSGAELANVVNEASLLAARKAQDFVTFRELLEGVQRTR
jgi:hypothetical protein